MKKESHRGTSSGIESSPKRTCLLVLGMHRSGTSALTRVLALLGAALPKNLMPAVKDNNEAGFWEPQLLANLHDQMLAEAGSRWDDWRAFDLAGLPEARLRYYKAEIGRLISEEYTDAPLFVLKDPRVCRFAPLYEEVLGELGVSPLFVHSLRNPLAVIGSHTKRDGMTEGFASLLWLRHVLDSEAATRGKARAFLSYEALLHDWRAGVEHVARALAFDWPRDVDEAASEIEAHLTRDLQHHAPDADELEADASQAAWVRKAYAALHKLAESRPESATALNALSQIKAEFDAAAPVFGKAAFPEMAVREARFQAAQNRSAALLDERKQNIDALTRQVEAKAQEIEGLNSGVADEKARRTAAETSLASVSAEKDALRLELDALMEEQESLNVQLTAAISERDLARSEEMRSRELIRAVYASTSWRVTGPIRTVKATTARFLTAGVYAFNLLRERRLSLSAIRRGIRRLARGQGKA